MYSEDGPGQSSRYSNSLQVGQSGGSNPGQGKIFHTHPDWPSGPPSLPYNMQKVSFLGVKQMGCGIEHKPPSSAEVKERVDLYFYSPSGPSWPVIGSSLPLLYTC